MSVTYRPGSALELVSIRCQTMSAGFGASAFVVTKTRPALVAAQTTLPSDRAASSVEMCPPERSSPHGYGAGHATVQAAVGVAAGGHNANGPYVRRPRCPGSPIAFQSSHTST